MRLRARRERLSRGAAQPESSKLPPPPLRRGAGFGAGFGAGLGAGARRTTGAGADLTGATARVGAGLDAAALARRAAAADAAARLAARTRALRARLSARSRRNFAARRRPALVVGLWFATDFAPFCFASSTWKAGSFGSEWSTSR
jgi:hypothetical protein